MKYYKKIPSEEKIQCLLCENRCILSEGQIGLCSANSNQGMELNSFVFGYPIAMNVDPIEKKPLSKFMPGTLSFSIGTFGCNMRCKWCQNHNISQVSASSLKVGNYYEPEEIVKKSIENNCKSISYTYNEPTIFYPYAKEVGLLAKQKGLKNVFVSNGFQTDEIIEDMATWIDACNIDLKSISKKTYKDYIKADIDIVLRNLKLLVKNKIHVEVTTLIIPDLNDSDVELREIASFIKNELGENIVWHVSAFYPSHKMTDTNRTPANSVLRAKKIGEDAGLKFVFTGNV